MKTNWQIKKLEDVIEKVTYSSKVHRKKFLTSGKFPVISQEADFINGYWNDEKDVFKVKTPIVIFGDHTQVLKYVDFDFVLGADGVKLLQPKPVLNPRFFYYFLNSINLKSLGYARHYRLLKEVDVSFPESLSEQKRIVAILDKAFADIEKAKANAEQNLKNAKELFESYLQSVFENKGDGWEEKTLGEVYDVRDGTHDSPKYQLEGYPLITSKNLKKDELNYNNVKYIKEVDYLSINKRSKVDVGDILFAMIGTIGNPVVIKNEPDFAIKNVALFKIPKTQNSYFLKYYLDSKSTIELLLKDAKGTTQKFVGLGYLRGFKIKLPSLLDQEKIVKKLDSLSAETKKLESIYQNKLANLEELKKSILQKAFNGELC